MIFRDAAAADAAPLAALHLASWRDAYRGVLDDAVLDVTAPAALARHWNETLPLAKPGAVILAMRNAAPVGFVAAYVQGRTAYVDNLHVAPGLRGVGIGRILLGLAARRLAALGCGRAELFVFSGNTRATRFYAALGAEVGLEQPTEVWSHPAVERRCLWPDITTLIDAAARAAPPA